MRGSSHFGLKAILMHRIWSRSVSSVSPFSFLQADVRKVSIEFDGDMLELAEGENLAAALLAAGVIRFRDTPVSSAPRAPFCMMGACYDCLVEIDGVSTQACMVQVHAGLKIKRLGGNDGADDAKL
jgi:hypothetical protein